LVVPAEWSQQLAFVGSGGGIRIRSLRNPDQKMSKSIDDPAGTILLSDSRLSCRQKDHGRNDRFSRRHPL